MEYEKKQLTEKEKNELRAKYESEFKAVMAKMHSSEKWQLMEYSKTMNKTWASQNCYFVDLVCIKYGLPPEYVSVFALEGDEIWQKQPRSSDNSPRITVDLRGMTRQQKIDYHKHRLQQIGSIKIDYIEDSEVPV